VKRFKQNLQAKFPSLSSSSSGSGESSVGSDEYLSSEAALSLSLSWSELTGESMPAPATGTIPRSGAGILIFMPARVVKRGPQNTKKKGRT